MKYSPHPKRAPVLKVRVEEGGGKVARVWNFRKGDIDKGITLQYYICVRYSRPRLSIGECTEQTLFVVLASIPVQVG